MSQMRREFLKAYVFSLFAEGEVDLNAPGVVKRVMAVVSGDLPVVAAELAQQYAEAAGRKIGAAVLGKAHEFLSSVADELHKGGLSGAYDKLKHFWGKAQANYKRGVDENAARGGK